MADAKSGRSTKKIGVTGIVQGVGFRPFVHRLACKHRLTGYVKNVSGSVQILATGKAINIDAFVCDMLENPPEHAKIECIGVEDAPYFFAEAFTVRESEGGAFASRFFSPDLALCQACRGEIFDQSDRRFGHYFNNCTSCGPRFSVLTAFPYDRANTSMREFGMCPQCGAEYREPADRRFHAETIACHNCGPALFYRSGDETVNGEQAFCKAVQALESGEIVAIKGVGGYHFACLPCNGGAVRKLREQKGRDDKPFAVMFRDIAAIEKVCEVSGADAKLLASPARPIVLLPLKNRSFAEEAIRGGGRCGCFLPYTPLQAMLMEKIPALVMTSANLSAEPIIVDDGEMLSKTGGVLYHNRRIIRGVEDSVAQTVCGGQAQIIRRARGYAPLPLELANLSGKNILAMGGDLKAAFALASGNFCTLSQFFGDLENAGVFKRYQEGVRDFTGLFAIKPELIVCDSHPAYFSSRIAKQLAESFGAVQVSVLHHHAHIASVMAEKNLSGKVIGVAFDGSGFGGDGNIWGGEFLVCEGTRCRRAAHLEYTALLGADSAAKDAGETAACFLYKSGLPFSHPAKDVISAALAHNAHTFLSSSVGRLFDAVAAITGVCSRNSYEGQCAAALQYLAEEAYAAGIAPVPMSFAVREAGDKLTIMQNEIVEAAFECAKGRSAAFALGFHLALADMVLNVCRWVRQREGASQVALSGGVFQNALLLSLCVDKLLHDGFSAHFNSFVPANDGGLALGQSYIAARGLL